MDRAVPNVQLILERIPHLRGGHRRVAETDPGDVAARDRGLVESARRGVAARQLAAPNLAAAEDQEILGLGW
jgi:hypothetical protein